MNSSLAVNLIKRPAYAFVGLLAGDAAMLLFLLQNALRNRADLLVLHMGEPARQIPDALQLFVLYGSLSFVGWLLVGLPIALFLPTRFVTSLSWPLRVFAGAALGPLALFAVLVLLGRGHFSFPGSFRGTESLWAFSILVSTVSFVLYAVLLHKECTATWTVKDLASGVLAIAIFLVTLFWLPRLGYVSIVRFGFPANLVVLGGYVAWLLFRRVNRSVTDMGAVAFALAVVCGLFFTLPGAPATVLLILLPSGLLWVILEVVSRQRGQVPPQSSPGG